MFLDESKRIKVISGHELSWKNNKGYAKARPFHALSFRICGGAEFEHDGKIHRVSFGDVVYVPEGYDYTITHKEDYLYVVHFEMEDGQFEDYFSITPADKNIMKNLFRKMYEIWSEKRTGYEFATTSVFYTILEQLKKELSQDKSTPSFAKMSEIMEYINTNYQDSSLTVAKLAELYGTSETFFRREFKRFFDETPLRYINNIRLKYAEELLHTGYYSIRDVAYKVGFTDPKYFSRFVKKERNIPPSKL